MKEVNFEDIKLYCFDSSNIIDALKFLDIIYHFINLLDDKENYLTNRTNYLSSRYLLLLHGSKALSSKDNKSD